jgi:hypothetical protein
MTAPATAITGCRKRGGTVSATRGHPAQCLTSAEAGNNSGMPAAALEMPTTHARAWLTTPTSDSDAGLSAPMVVVTSNGKTLQQESFDSAQVSGIAILVAAAMLLAILTGTVMFLIG